MLPNTFLHLPNLSETRERKLWRAGVKTWDDFLNRFGPLRSHAHFCKTIAKSKYALDSNDPDFFALVLPKSERWRAFPHFPSVAYLDIETTGLSADNNELTVIGVYDGQKTNSFIRGQNLEDFRTHIEQYDAMVTFNGSIFDAPFLKKAMPGVKLPELHIDLRFLLSSLGINGGLKKIEQKFGYEREDDLKGLTGYDAVKLWQKYIRNKDDAALETLVRYNAADISNLKLLMEWAYKEKRRQSGIDG